MNYEEFERNIRYFLGYMSSESVYLVVYDAGEHESDFYVSFRTHLKFKDKCVDIEAYKYGGAVIYLSDKFYELFEKELKDVFGSKSECSWNNTRYIANIVIKKEKNL